MIWIKKFAQAIIFNIISEQMSIKFILKFQNSNHWYGHSIIKKTNCINTSNRQTVRPGTSLVTSTNAGSWSMREDFSGLTFTPGSRTSMSTWLLDSELRYVRDVEGRLLLYGLYVFSLINVGLFTRRSGRAEGARGGESQSRSESDLLARERGRAPAKTWNETVLIALIKEKRKHSIMKAQTSPWP